MVACDYRKRRIMEQQLRFYKGLAKQYPTIASAATEIINLQAILNLPKGTEHFITDVHGEYLQFRHILRNASGAIRRKIDDVFGPTLRTEEKKELAALIYYPQEKLEQIITREKDIEEWYQITIHRLIRLARSAASKYTRSKVRKAIDPDFAYVIEELMTGRPDEADQEAYYNEIIHSVITTDRAKEMIVACADLIRRMVVDHLHVVGDIYDRGPSPHLIMDALMKHHSVDIQWGNHDVLWMGAAAGSRPCICNVIRIAARYGNLSTLEEGYGINLLPLAKLAIEYYGDDPCTCFREHSAYKHMEKDQHLTLDTSLEEKMHKAITIIQFKIEGQMILAHPEFEMQDRLLLDKIDLKKGTVRIDGVDYPMKDCLFPTLDTAHPYQLTVQEQEVIDQIQQSFVHCEKLQQHIRFLYSHGSLYKVYNGNLLYHGCIPLTKDGEFLQVKLFGKKYAGRALYDVLDSYARKGYYASDTREKQRGQEILWYLWENPNSPVFGKEKMATFERYFLEEPSLHVEPKNPYYHMLNDEEMADAVLKEFGLSGADAHIVNGHIPVEAKAGESPVKCNGKLLIIDGGLSKAYQPKTGIAGYTLIYNSYGLVLAAHEPFTSVAKAVEQGSDIHSDRILVQQVTKRKRVADTDTGKELAEMVADLEGLLDAYRTGLIQEGRN